MLKAVLFRPDGAGPFPAVIGLHGCEGLLEKDGTLATRYRDWAQHLTAAGFVVVYPDSYGSRGLGSQCAIRRRAIRTDHERVADANAARRWLQAQGFVKPDHVTLIGWATGGISALWTVRRKAVLPKDDKTDFRSAVAFYPGCRRLDNAAWSARVPTLILIGAADDQTSAQVCQRMVAGARGRSAGASIIVYPGHLPRLRPPEPAAAGARRLRLRDRQLRQDPHRHQPGRARRCAAARAAMAGAVG